MLELTNVFRTLRRHVCLLAGIVALAGTSALAQDFKLDLPLDSDWHGQAAPVRAGAASDAWGPRVEVKLPGDPASPSTSAATSANLPNAAADAAKLQPMPDAASGANAAPVQAAAPAAVPKAGDVPAQTTGVTAAVAAPGRAGGPEPTDTLTVGVGDQLLVTVFGQPDMSAEVTVNENGQVTLALVGTLKVGGLVPPAVERLIAQRLRDGQYLREPAVSVQVRQVRSQMVSVLGEVQRPGRFPITGKLSVLDALATAGGLTTRADHTVYLLRRKADGSGERQEIPLRLDQVIDSGRGALDVEVHNDDVIFVGLQKLFYIHGEVHRPGSYPMEPGLNIMRALSIGGGVTDRGSLSRVRIYRKGSDGRDHEIKPDLSAEVRSGDVIYVDERLF